MTETRSIYIGLDDTDFGDSIGTGAMARELMVHLQTRLGTEARGITRHQFLVHPDIPYTSHNSAACLEVGTDADVETVAEICRTFVRFLFHPGADPGLCVALPGQISHSMLQFGQLAQREVVQKADALTLAADSALILEEHGGEGIGVIGALGACALRVDGNDGRFISHRGIREFTGIHSVKVLKTDTAIEQVRDRDQDDRFLEDTVQVETSNWLRPDLVQGKVTLFVRRIGPDGVYAVQKKKKGTDDM